jgi:hypothetical protein
MNRKGLLTCLALSGLMATIISDVRAADSLADELLKQWQTELRSMTRVSISFRLRQFNDIFGTEKEGPAVYFRDGQYRWVLCVGWEPAVPVSALRPLNGSQMPAPVEPWKIISTLDEACFGDGAHSERVRLGPVSAHALSNVPRWSSLFRDVGADLLAALADDASMPLFLPESTDFSTFEVRATQHANGDQWLILRPSTGTKWQRRFQQVDAVFRIGGSLPYAVRVIEPSGAGRVHYLFDDIRRGCDAFISKDAFEP